MNDNTTTMAAVRMMRERGVDDAESLLTSTDPQAIIRTCEWADKKKASTRLLVWKIKQGGVPEEDVPVSKTVLLREMFDRYVQAHPVGSRLCSHAALAARKWPDDREDCIGQLIVAGAAFPVLEMLCDQCAFEAALTPRVLRGVAA